MEQTPSDIQDVSPKDGSTVSEASSSSAPCDDTLLDDSGLRAKVEECALQVLFQQTLIKIPDYTLLVSGPHEQSDFYSMTFPRKLWKIVESDQFKSIWWDEEGTSIVINEDLFKKEVLERKTPFRIFETNSMKSLIRQLNLYGFSKIQQNVPRSASLDDFLAEEKDVSANLKKLQFYHNPNFRRGHPHLLVKMKRRVGVKNASGVTASLLPKFNKKLSTEGNVDTHTCGAVDEASEKTLLPTSANSNVPLIKEDSTGQGTSGTAQLMKSDFCPPTSSSIITSEQIHPGQHAVFTHLTALCMHSHGRYTQADGTIRNFLSTSSSQYHFSPLQNTHFGLCREPCVFPTRLPAFSGIQSPYPNLLPPGNLWLPIPKVTNTHPDSYSVPAHQPSSLFQHHPTSR